MGKFQDTFETRKRSFISAFLICMTVPLSYYVELFKHRENLFIYQKPLHHFQIFLSVDS